MPLIRKIPHVAARPNSPLPLPLPPSSAAIEAGETMLTTPPASFLLKNEPSTGMRARFEKMIRDAQDQVCAGVEKVDGTKFRTVSSRETLLGGNWAAWGPRRGYGAGLILYVPHFRFPISATSPHRHPYPIFQNSGLLDSPRRRRRNHPRAGWRQRVGEGRRQRVGRLRHHAP